MNQSNKTILLIHIGGIDNTEIENIENSLSKVDIQFKSHNTSGSIHASLSDFSLSTFLIINQPIIIELLRGIAINATWEIIKETIIYIHKKLKGKKIYRIDSNGTKEEKDITFGFNASLDENTSFNFEIKGNEETVLKSLDKVFIFLKNQKNNTTNKISHHVEYSEKEDKWTKIDVLEEMKKKRNL